MTFMPMQPGAGMPMPMMGGMGGPTIPQNLTPPIQPSPSPQGALGGMMGGAMMDPRTMAMIQALGKSFGGPGGQAIGMSGVLPGLLAGR